MNLRKAVSAALVGRGYRHEGRLHLLRLDQSFCYWVDTGPLERRSDIAPFVGIRNDRVETLFTELMGLSPDSWVGTVGANVGYILGEGYRRWDEPSPPAEVLRSIDSALECLKAFLSLERLPEVWEIQGAKAPGWRCKEIAVLLLAGQHQAVLQRLEAARAEYCKYEDAVCDQFRAFEQRVKSRYFSGNATVC